MKNISKLKLFLIILFFGFVFSVIFTYPLILNLKTYYNDKDDYAQAGYYLSYNTRAIESKDIFNADKYRQSNQFYPFAFSKVTIDLLITPTLIFAPVFSLFKDVVLSLNIFTILSLALIFVVSFYSLNYFIDNKKAAILGAFIYAFNPLIYARYMGYLILLPLLFLYADKYFRKPDFKNSILFYIAVLLNALTTVYFQIYIILVIPFFVMPIIINNFLLRNRKYFINLLKTSVIALPVLLIVIYFDYPYIQFSKMEGIKRTISESAYFSARPVDFLSSNPDNLIYGNFVKQIEPERQPKEYDNSFNYAEHTLFLNIVPFLLFSIGIYLCIIKIKEGKKRGLFISFIIVLLFSFLIMLGPYLISGNKYITAFKLPYYYLYQILPFFKAIRAPTRFGLIFYFPFAFFVSYSLKRIFSNHKYNNKIIFGCILFLFILENIHINSYQKTSLIHENISYLKKNNPAIINLLNNKKVMHFPTYVTIPNRFYEEVKYLTWSVYTNELLLNSQSFLPPDWISFLTELNNELNSDNFKKLRAMEADYVIIHKNLYNKDLPELSKIYFIDTISDLISQSTTYQDKDLLILDLSKYNFQIPKCSLTNDFDKKIQISSYAISVQPVNAQLTLINKYNCFLYSNLDKRYLKADIFLDGQKYNTVYFKLPFLIQPFEKTVLSETINLKSDSITNISTGTHKIKADISGLKIDATTDIYIDKSINNYQNNYIFSKFNSITPNNLHFQVDRISAEKSANSVIIDADVLNDGDSVWLAYTGESGVNSLGAVNLVSEFYNVEKKLLNIQNNPLIRMCSAIINIPPGEKTNFYCRFNLNKDLINQIKYAKLYLVVYPKNNILQGTPFIYEFK